jgi:hypothetical protein
MSEPHSTITTTGPEPIDPFPPGPAELLWPGDEALNTPIESLFYMIISRKRLF